MTEYLAHHLPTGLIIKLEQCSTRVYAEHMMLKVEFYIWDDRLTYTYYGRRSAVEPVTCWIGIQPEQFEIIEV